MHIVHVTHRAWPVAGGSERYTQEIARRQVLDGHRVTIVATNALDLAALWDRDSRRAGPETPAAHQGVRIVRVPAHSLPFGRATFPALRRFARVAGFLSWQAALPLAHFSPWTPELRRALTAEAADVFFAWNLTLEGMTAATAREAQRRNVPWVAVPLLHLGREWLCTMPHQLALLRKANYILAQTPSERDFLLRHRIAAECVRLVSPGVDLDQAGRADGRRFRQAYSVDGPLVLSLGTMGHDKGTPHLLAAVRALREEGSPVIAVVVGPQPKHAAWTANRECAWWRCLGEVSEEDKWDAVDAADVVALPSRTESFGIVFLEAWACSKPVVGARAGAVPDVVEDGVDGLLVNFGDVAGLIEALRWLIANPARAAEMGRHGREKVRRNYTWDAQYSRWRQVLDELESKR